MGSEMCIRERFTGISAMFEQVQDLLEPGAYVQRGDRRLDVEHFAEAFDWLQKEARRGIDLQRYKGLGEMNPAQLWETTMDENARTLHQVKVGHADEAGELFSTLMGDLVEPRRDFIQSNALKVENLDV